MNDHELFLDLNLHLVDEVILLILSDHKESKEIRDHSDHKEQNEIQEILVHKEKFDYKESSDQDEQMELME